MDLANCDLLKMKFILFDPNCYVNETSRELIVLKIKEDIPN